MCGCVCVFQSELASPFALLLGTCHRETFWRVWPSECFTVHNTYVTAQILSTLLSREYRAYVPLSLQGDLSTQSFEIGFYEAAPIVEVCQTWCYTRRNGNKHSTFYSTNQTKSRWFKQFIFCTLGFELHFVCYHLNISSWVNQRHESC